jgi:hypothetical protein
MNYCSDVIVSQDILYLQLSMWRCSDELRVMVDHLHRSSKKDMTKHYIGEDGMLIFFKKKHILYPWFLHMLISSAANIWPG